MEERVMLFRRKYPDSLASVYKLRKLYYEAKARKKVIRKTKLTTKAQQEDIVMQVAELRESVQLAIEYGKRLIYLDEYMLTK